MTSIRMLIIIGSWISAVDNIEEYRRSIESNPRAEDNMSLRFADLSIHE